MPANAKSVRNYAAKRKYNLERLLWAVKRTQIARKKSKSVSSDTEIWVKHAKKSL